MDRKIVATCDPVNCDGNRPEATEANLEREVALSVEDISQIAELSVNPHALQDLAYYIVQENFLHSISQPNTFQEQYTVVPTIVIERHHLLEHRFQTQYLQCTVCGRRTWNVYTHPHDRSVPSGSHTSTLHGRGLGTRNLPPWYLDRSRRFIPMRAPVHTALSSPEPSGCHGYLTINGGKPWNTFWLLEVMGLEEDNDVMKALENFMAGRGPGRYIQTHRDDR